MNRSKGNGKSNRYEVRGSGNGNETEFALSDISLDGTDTIYGQNMARDLEYLKVMDADRMLYTSERPRAD